MTTKQLNVRLPEVVIDDLNRLATIYGSQAKALIAAIVHLRKEVEMQQVKRLLDDIDSSKSEAERLLAADKAISAISGLPDEQQEEIARQEFLRFRDFVESRGR